MAVSTKMTVDVSGFKSGMQQAQASVKTLDAELKKNEAQFKATGNAEDYMAKKADILKQKLSTQKQAVDQAEKALNAMGKEVDKNSVEYQKMAQTLLNAQTAMLETQSALDGLSSSEKAAAEGANNLNQSVQSINKKVSLDQVISGINGITSVMEKAASVAVRLGDTIWSSIMDSAQLADEIATNAAIMGIDTTEYQQYKGVFDTFAEITVRDWMNAKRKIETAMVSPSNAQTDALKALGFDTYVGSYVENGKLKKRQIADNWEDAMWQIAGEIRTRVESGQLTEEMADVYGMALFGKNYSALKPMFDMGQEGFNAEKETIKAANEEAIKNEALLNDTVIKLTGTFEALKMQALGTLAPALTAAAEAIDNLLGSILEYLQTDEGQEMLRQMGESLGELFSGITEISASEVVAGFKSVFDDLVGGIKWLAEHKDDVLAAIEGIFGVFTGLEVSKGVLTLIQLFNGAKTLFGGGGNGGSPTGTGIGGGSGLGLLATKVASGLSSNLTMYDPTGATALIGNAVMDLTTYGWERKTGKSIGEALKAQWGEITGGINAEGIAASAEEAKKYWFEQVPNAFWGVFGFKDANEAASTFARNSAVAGEYTFGDITAEEAMRIINGEPVDVVLNPVVEEDAQTSIQEQVGTVTIPVNLAVQGTGLLGSFMEAALGLVPGGSNEGHGFANGLPWVNSDGLYLLHRGERVLTASQNRNYTYNSNNYFGNVNLNNGQDIEALCDSIDRHNRRRQSGFGE